MAQIETTITIGALSELPFEVEYVSISEAFDRHHTFEITASLPIGKSLSNEQVKQLLGEYVTIEISTEIKNLARKIKAAINIEKPQKHVFKGITDNLVLFQQDHSKMIRIEGFSPSILMDSAPSFRTFSEQSVQQIAEKILTNYRTTIPQTKFNINANSSFSVQTQETDYQYLCRLADQHKANFFYDGEQFHFAPIRDIYSDMIELTNEESLNHFRASVNLSPIKFSVNGYNHLKDEKQEKSYDLSKNGNSLVLAAIEKSSVYPPVNISLNYCIEDEKALKNVGLQLATQQTNSLVSISGGSDVPSIKVGSILDIKGGKSVIPGFNKKEKFRVTQVSHSVSGGGTSYSNSFSAIPENNECPVNTPGTQAKVSAPLMAEIMETNDPEKLGRVQVRFLLDEEESVSPWLRVLTPFSSRGGHFFIPEKGEKVVIFFEDFNPEKSPFVLGSFWTPNQNSEDWKDTNNRKKGIQTGDISLLFDENEGKLTIKAKQILLETSEGVTIEAGKELQQKAQNIQSEAQQKNEISGSQSVKVKGARIDLN